MFLKSHLATNFDRRRGNAPRFACELFLECDTVLWHSGETSFPAGATFIPTFRRCWSFPAVILHFNATCDSSLLSLLSKQKYRTPSRLYLQRREPCGFFTVLCGGLLIPTGFCRTIYKFQIKNRTACEYYNRTASLSASSLFYSVGIWRYRLKNFRFQISEFKSFKLS